MVLGFAGPVLNGSRPPLEVDITRCIGCTRNLKSRLVFMTSEHTVDYVYLRGS